MLKKLHVIRDLVGNDKNSVANCIYYIFYLSFIHSFILWAGQLMPRKHLSLGLIVQPLSVHSTQIQQPCAFYVEAKISYWDCAYFFWFDKQIPKNAVALTSQRLAAANNMLHCFSLLPAESAGWIPIKQVHSIQVPSYRGVSREDGVSLRRCLLKLGRYIFTLLRKVISLKTAHN
jgi:hypothetical protein